MWQGYQEQIRGILAGAGYIGKYEPRHIEAWMRLEHPTLDGLSKPQFRAEVLVAAQCVDEAGVEQSEALAELQGLAVR